MIYMTADTNYRHTKVIEYCNRPFESIEEMNEKLIENYNKRVKDKDVVYFLGDISFFPDPNDFYLKVFKRLRGKKHLIFGNHDKRFREELGKMFLTAQDYLELKFEKQFTVMSHYPMLTWNKGHHGSWMLHGHSHGTLDDVNKQSISEGKFRWDVGVDGNNYSPISWDELKEKFK